MNENYPIFDSYPIGFHINKISIKEFNEMICNRCRKSNLGNCTLTYHKTEEQIQREQYGCFQERIFNINSKPYNSDGELQIYGNEVNYNQLKLHLDMARSERNRRNGKKIHSN
jgi:hypothetical protein